MFANISSRRERAVRIEEVKSDVKELAAEDIERVFSRGKN
jgi:hypothetical protein